MPNRTLLTSGSRKPTARPYCQPRISPQISTGMAPKMAACLRAVRGGVGRATVVDGRLPHALLLEMLTSEGTGTMVVP